MQQTTAPHRVARSAKDLASATLSGAAFELKNLRDSKYAATSSQASTSFEHISSGSARSRPGINARGSSFRNETDDIHRRRAEQDFERFQQLDDLQSEFAACLTSLHDTIPPQGSSYGSHRVLITEPACGTSEVVKVAETSTIDANESTSRNYTASESIQETNLDSARTAAVRRLNQIGAHLQRNLEIQTLQQEAYLQSHALLNGTRSHALNQLTRQADTDTRNTTHTTEATSSSHTVQKSATPQDRDQITHIDNPAKSPSRSEKEDDMLQRQFHCPYYACHRNLQLRPTSSSSSSRRPCVHVSCDITIETLSSWIEHIHMPHHDLLGSV